MASWARALLSQTRLLLDSPAAVDPARQRLLQDLELVLVQMTQLSPANTPIDRELIAGSVRHSDVITRLRTAVPCVVATHLQYARIDMKLYILGAIVASLSIPASQAYAAVAATHDSFPRGLVLSAVAGPATADP